jgi:hypothetical protein
MSLVPTTQPFSQKLHEWNELRTQISSLQEQLKPLKERQQQLSTEMRQTMRDKNRLNLVVDLQDGFVRVQSRKEYSGMTFQYINQCMETLIPDDEQRQYVLQYLKDNRTIREVEELKYTKRT